MTFNQLTFSFNAYNRWYNNFYLLQNNSSGFCPLYFMLSNSYCNSYSQGREFRIQSSELRVLSSLLCVAFCRTSGSNPTVKAAKNRSTTKTAWLLPHRKRGILFPLSLDTVHVPYPLLK